MSNNKKQAAVIVFFVVPRDKKKWITSNQRKNIQKLIQAPMIHDMHSIQGYAVILHKYELDAVRGYAAMYNIEIYKEFVEYSNAKSRKMAYHIKHYHDLSNVHSIPPKRCPQGWGKIDKIANTIETIKSENSGLRVYYEKYDVIHVKLLSIYNEQLIAIKRKLKLFEIRSNWGGIPFGIPSYIPVIFEQSLQRKNKIYPAIEHRDNPHHTAMNKNKRKRKKKQNKKNNNIRHVNAYIKAAHEMMITKVTESTTLFDVKSNNEEYKYLANYAKEKWNISWNDFVNCKQIRGGPQFGKKIELKTVGEVRRLFVAHKENNS